MASNPELKAFVAKNPHEDLSIDFSNPDAVKALNRALLLEFYGIKKWDIPRGYLCPPVPGRADYLHYAADLLAGSNGEIIPRGDSVRVLDIGVGANCIYPIIGHHDYGWSFVGAEIDPIALASAKRIVELNPALSGKVSIRLQRSASGILKGIVADADLFDLTVCNPPFHASLEESRKSSQRKWNALKVAPRPNFGGQGSELWCPGGEEAFVGRMIEESVAFSKSVFWFSTLISKESSLRSIHQTLKKARAIDTRTIEMAQGNKKSRFVAWTFLNPKLQGEWRANRWKK